MEESETVLLFIKSKGKTYTLLAAQSAVLSNLINYSTAALVYANSKCWPIHSFVKDLGLSNGDIIELLPLLKGGGIIKIKVKYKKENKSVYRTISIDQFEKNPKFTLGMLKIQLLQILGINDKYDQFNVKVNNIKEDETILLMNFIRSNIECENTKQAGEIDADIKLEIENISANLVEKLWLIINYEKELKFDELESTLSICILLNEDVVLKLKKCGSMKSIEYIDSFKKVSVSNICNIDCYVFRLAVKMNKNDTRWKVVKEMIFDKTDIMFEIGDKSQETKFLLPINCVQRENSNCVFYYDIVNVYALIHYLVGKQDMEELKVVKFITQQIIEGYSMYKGYYEAKITAFQQIFITVNIKDIPELHALSYFLKFIQVNEITEMETLIQKSGVTNIHKCFDKAMPQPYETLSKLEMEYKSIIKQITILLFYSISTEMPNDLTKHYTKFIISMYKSKLISPLFTSTIWSKFQAHYTINIDEFSHAVPDFNLLLVENCLSNSTQTNNDALKIIKLIKGIIIDDILSRAINEISLIIKKNKCKISDPVVIQILNIAIELSEEKRFKLIALDLASTAMPLLPPEDEEMHAFVIYFNYLPLILYKNTEHEYILKIRDLCAKIVDQILTLNKITIKSAQEFIPRSKQYIDFIIDAFKLDSTIQEKCNGNLIILLEQYNEYKTIESFKQTVNAIKPFLFIEQIASKSNNSLIEYVANYSAIKGSIAIFKSMESLELFQKMLISSGINDVVSFNLLINRIHGYIHSLLDFAEKWGDLKFNELKLKLNELLSYIPQYTIEQAIYYYILHFYIETSKRHNFDKNYYNKGIIIEKAITNCSQNSKPQLVMDSLNLLQQKLKLALEMSVHDMMKDNELILIANMLSEYLFTKILQEIIANAPLYLILVNYCDTDYEYLIQNLNIIEDVNMETIKEISTMQQFFRLFIGKIDYKNYKVMALNVISDLVLKAKKNSKVLDQIIDFRSLSFVYLKQAIQILNNTSIIIKENKNKVHCIMKESNNEFIIQHLNKLLKLRKKITEKGIEESIFSKFNEFNKLIKQLISAINKFNMLPFLVSEIGNTNISVINCQMANLSNFIFQINKRTTDLTELHKSNNKEKCYEIAVLFGLKLWKLEEYLNSSSLQYKARGLLKYIGIETRNIIIPITKNINTEKYKYGWSIETLSDLFSTFFKTKSIPKLQSSSIKYCIANSIISCISPNQRPYSLYYCHSNSTIESIYTFLNHTSFETNVETSLLFYPEYLLASTQAELIKLFTSEIQNYKLIIVLSSLNSNIFKELNRIGLLSEKIQLAFNLSGPLLNCRCIISDKPGAGKTRSIKYLTKSNNTNSSSLCIIALRNKISNDLIIKKIHSQLNILNDNLNICFQIGTIKNYYSLLQFLINLIIFKMVVSNDDAIYIEDSWNLFIEIQCNYKANIMYPPIDEGNTNYFNEKEMWDRNVCYSKDIDTLLKSIKTIKCDYNLNKIGIIGKSAPEINTNTHIIVYALKVLSQNTQLKNEDLLKNKLLTFGNEERQILKSNWESWYPESQLNFYSYKIFKRLMLYQIKCFQNNQNELFYKSWSTSHRSQILWGIYLSIKTVIFQFANTNINAPFCRREYNWSALFDISGNLHVFYIETLVSPAIKNSINALIQNKAYAKSNFRIYKYLKSPNPASTQFSLISEIATKIFDGILLAHPSNTDIAKNDFVITNEALYYFNYIDLHLRSNLPIFLIGNSGVGKTILIKYFSKYVSHSILKILNVHSATNENDIESFMDNVCAEYDGIIKNHFQSNKIQDDVKKLTPTDKNESIKKTVNDVLDAFEYLILFDEFNTSKHLDLIADIMITKRYKNVKLPLHMKFLATGRPYLTKDNMLHYNIYDMPTSSSNFVMNIGGLPELDFSVYIRSVLKSNNMVIDDGTTELIQKCHIFVEEQIGYPFNLGIIKNIPNIIRWLSNSWFNSNNYFKKSVCLALYVCYYIQLHQSNDSLNVFLQSICKNVELQNLFKDTIKGELNLFSKLTCDKYNRVFQSSSVQNVIMSLVIGVCSQIPVFLIGDTGCGKSLIINALKTTFNSECHTKINNNLPKIIFIHFQATKQTTFQSIINEINLIAKKQSECLNKYLKYTFVLDNIELLIDSKNNSLDALYQFIDSVILKKNNIGFVGISNCKISTGKGINVNLSNYIDDLYPLCCHIYHTIESQINTDIDQIIDLIVKIYIKNVYKVSNIYSLRDLYGTIKQLAFCTKNNPKPTSSDIIHSLATKCIEFNFSSCHTQIYNEDNICAQLQKAFMNPKMDASKYKGENNLGSSSIYVATTSCSSAEHLQNIIDNAKYLRYIMIITNETNENNIIQKINEIKKYDIINGDVYNDNECKSIYSLITKVIEKCAKGDKIIMVNCESIYSNLYDLFNQTNKNVSGNEYCNIVIEGKCIPYCYVNPEFHCIVVTNNKMFYQLGNALPSRFAKFYI